MGRKNADTNQRLLITQKEMVLIKASNEVKDVSIYGNLYDCIEAYDKLSKADLDNNIVYDKKARVVLLNPENKKTMKQKIMDEWYSAKDPEISDTLVKCQLCGRPNKYIYYIHNRILDTELHIGSDCVKEFSDIAGIKQHTKQLAQIKKEQDQLKRKIKFEAREGDEIGFIEDAENKFKEFPVMLPYKLHNEIKDVIYQLNLSKTTYVKNGGKLDEIYATYCMLKDRFKNLYAQANKHYEAVRNNFLTCDRETAEWLLKNNQSVWEKVSKANGIFSAETLMKIYDDKYINKVIGEILKHLKDKDIRLLQVSKSFIRFSIKNDRYVYMVTFTMPIKKFMECIGCYALTDAQYSFGKEKLQDISIEVSNTNYHAVYNSVFEILNTHGYDFIVEDKTSQAYWKKLSQFERKSKWSDSVVQIDPLYKKSDIGLFLQVLSPFLLKDETYLERNFDSIVKNMGMGKAWITQKEKNDREEAAKLARGMQKQREFIPY